MAPRIYATKGDAALKAKITVTLRPALLEKVEQQARELKIDKTTFARDAIERRVAQIEAEPVVA